ncbi:MAG: transcription factor TFIIIB subunit brf1 [Chrysothrix sp. TS-e1954]|nr:MAG: transcription factor TFIIIB subunit brf1 [Chrysothrix sp. TS-e1954]
MSQVQLSNSASSDAQATSNPSSAPDVSKRPRFPKRARLFSAKNPLAGRDPENLAQMERERSMSRSIQQSRHGTPAPASSTPKCCAEPDIRESDNTKVCMNCATVIREANIVNDVTFGESNAGAPVVQGGFVGQGQRHAKTLGSAFKRMGGAEGKEATENIGGSPGICRANRHVIADFFFEIGRDELRKQSSYLGLPEAIFESAFNVYKLASSNNFIQGRRIRHVAAVCLYVACRRDKTNITLLIDFAELLHVNVYKLGAVYQSLKNDLWLHEYEKSGVGAVMQPEMLIERYAKKLEFGNAVYKVAEDASKIMKRMGRDWMVTGRVPSGLCGACLVLAARMNNFRRSVREVVFVVKVADLTISKRMEEFQRTQSSKLSVQDFREKGLLLKDKALPPSIYMREENDRPKKRQKRGPTGNDEQQQPGGTDTDGTSSSRHTSTLSPQQELRRDADGFAIPAIPAIPVDPALESSSQSTVTRGSKRKATESSTLATQNTANTSQETTASSQSSNDAVLNGSPTESPSEPPNLRRSKRKAPSDPQPSNLATPPASQDCPTAPNIQSQTEAPTATVEETSQTSQPPAKKQRRGRPPTIPREPTPPLEITEDDLLADGELEKEIDEILADPETRQKMDEEQLKRFEERSLEIAEQQRAIDAEARLQNNPPQVSDAPADGDSQTGEPYPTPPNTQTDTQTSTTTQPAAPSQDLDAEAILPSEFATDPEINSCLLTPADSAIKERIWTTHNADWIRLKNARALRKALDEAHGIVKKTRARPKRGKRARMGDGSVLEGEEGEGPVNSPEEAARRMLRKHATKGWTKYLDYEQLKRAYGGIQGGGSETAAASSERAGSTVPSEADDAASQAATETSAASSRPSGIIVRSREGSTGRKKPGPKPSSRARSGSTASGFTSGFSIANAGSEGAGRTNARFRKQMPAEEAADEPATAGARQPTARKPRAPAARRPRAVTTPIPTPTPPPHGRSPTPQPVARHGLEEEEEIEYAPPAPAANESASKPQEGEASDEGDSDDYMTDPDEDGDGYEDDDDEGRRSARQVLGQYGMDAEDDYDDEGEDAGFGPDDY